MVFNNGERSRTRKSLYHLGMCFGYKYVISKQERCIKNGIMTNGSGVLRFTRINVMTTKERNKVCDDIIDLVQAKVR